MSTVTDRLVQSPFEIVQTVMLTVTDRLIVVYVKNKFSLQGVLQECSTV